MGRIHRLTKAADFKRVYRQGRKLFAPDLKVYVFEREEGGESRLGFLVGKRAGKATERNRLKRRLREVCRRHQENLKEGLDLVVVVKKSLLEKTFSQVEKACLRTFKKGGVLKE